MLGVKYFNVILLVVAQFTLIANSTDGHKHDESSPLSFATLSDSEVGSVVSDKSERSRIRLGLDQVKPSKWPVPVPSCPQGHDYDATAKFCAKTRTTAHCGDNMVFYPVEMATGVGACACSNIASDDCWGRPQAIIKTQNNQCGDMGTRGPCKLGEVIVPIDEYNAECGPDACLHATLENPRNLPHAPEVYPVFNFTYRGKCFTTESQAFCEQNRVVRFIMPFKIPACVYSDQLSCSQIESDGDSDYGMPSAQFTTLRICETGTILNPYTETCQKDVGSDLV